MAAAAVLLGAPAALAAGVLRDTGHTTWVPAERAAGAAAPGGERAADPASARAAEAIDDVISAQARAVAGGDATAFLAAVDGPLGPAMRRRFEALRAVRATGYDVRRLKAPVPDRSDWRVTVEVTFCSGAPGCGHAPVRVPTRWTITADGARLVEWGQSTHYGPRPWEVSELRAAVGERVVVASSPRYASRLQATLAAAERAAAKADRFARWRPRPSRYVVYLAGPDEWSTWYGVKQPAWAAGYAMPITADHTEIVLNAGRIDAGEALTFWDEDAW